MSEVSFDAMPAMIADMLTRISSIENTISNPNSTHSYPPEVLTQKELCKKLNVSEGTLIDWRKKGKVPFMQIRGNIRYNLPDVIYTLTNAPKK